MSCRSCNKACFSCAAFEGRCFRFRLKATLKNSATTAGHAGANCLISGAGSLRVLATVSSIVDLTKGFRPQMDSYKVIVKLQISNEGAGVLLSIASGERYPTVPIK